MTAGDEGVPGETIAAISTPPGEGAIALVRLSGANAIVIADQIFRGAEAPSAFAPHTQRLGAIWENGALVDEVVLSVHRAPASYTGEDLVEISCHGGTLVSARVLEACLHAGARMARAGEFTERAFLHGKIDLTQAEAVMDLIRAQSDLALRSASEQLRGELGRAVEAIRSALISLLAQIEAALDFAEEDIGAITHEEVARRIAEMRAQTEKMLASAGRGRIFREGFRVVLFGPTNAGKSSLLNRLLGYPRAIVSAIPGTTRDTIEERVQIAGVPIRLLDTAGLRATADELEQQGIARTGESLALADLALHIVDSTASRPAEQNVAPAERAEILLLNKSDLPAHPDWRDTEALRISCVTGAGFDALEMEIARGLAALHVEPESNLAINTRHRACLRRAAEALARAEETCAQKLSLEYIAVDLRAAWGALDELLGRKRDDEVLDSVFQQFCIGK